MSREAIVLSIAALAVLGFVALRARAPVPADPREPDARVPAGDQAEAASRPCEGPGGSPFDPGGWGRIAVTVTSAADDRPEAGVRVDVLPFRDSTGRRRRLTAVTDDGGNAAFESVPAGPVKVFAGSVSRSFSVDAAGRHAVAIALRPQGRVAVVVVAPDGAPVVHAAVWLSSGGSSLRGDVAGETGPGGRCVLLRAPPGHAVSVRAPGFAWSRTSEIPAAGSGATPELRFAPAEPARSLRGRVVDDGGRPLEGAWVACAPDDGRTPMLETIALGDGTFALEGVAPGGWRVEAWAEGLAPAIAGVTVERSDPADVTLVLRSGATVHGTARDREGRPLPRILVSGAAASGIGDGIPAMTGDDGRFRLEHLPGAPVRARAGYLAGARPHTPLDLTGLESLEWNPVIEDPVVLHGLVSDEEGKGRAFARVRASSGGAKEVWVAETIADRSGRFEVPLELADTVSLEVDVATWPDGGAWSVADVRPGADPLVIRIPESAKPTSFVTGKVAAADGAPLVAIEVAATPVRNPPGHPAAAFSKAPDGAFRLGPLPPGGYAIDAVTSGGARMRLAECALEAREELDIGARTVERAGFLKAFLTRGRGAPRSQRLVVMDERSRRVAALRPVVDFAASGPMGPGRYVLRVEGAGVAAGEIPFEIRAGETTTIEVPIEAAR